MQAVRPHEHAAAKTREPLARLIELLDRIHRGPDAAVSISASVSHPHGHAIPVDGDAVGGAPRPPLRFHSPVPDHAIWIGAAVDGLNFLRPAFLQRYPRHDRRGEREFRETQNRHYALLSLPPLVSRIRRSRISRVLAYLPLSSGVVLPRTQYHVVIRVRRGDHRLPC